MPKYSSLLVGLFVILLIPDLRYAQVAFQSPARLSAQRNLERAQYYAGKPSTGDYWGYTRYQSSMATSIQGYVSIRRSQRNASTVNQGSGNVVANEAGVIGDSYGR